MWKKILEDFPNEKLIQYLEFGFPLSLQAADSLNNSTACNHHSAMQHARHVEEYLQTEMAHGAILGPFDDISS